MFYAAYILGTLRGARVQWKRRLNKVARPCYKSGSAMNQLPLPSCPDPLPEDLDKELVRLASMWAKDPARPRLDSRVAQHWDELVMLWSVEPSLPLLLRKSEKQVIRGEVIHHETGRQLVLTDNSPAS